MKFGKSLNNQIEDALPEWRDKFLSYKELKKKLKLFGAAKSGEEKPAKRQRLDESSNESAALTPEEREFIKLLDDELEKFNGFFVEKEEEYIIRQKLLQERVEKVKHSNKEEMIKVRREIVDFHGEMVLLENYSALNYTGLVKILKKYDKRTGGLMRLPFIQRVLQQPFFTTDLLYKLVKESERMLDQLFPADEPSTSAAEPEPVTADGNSVPDTKPLLKEARELEDIEYMESLYMKSTMAALRALKEIRSGSSTVSVFSLPPLQQNNGPEESWSKIPYLEQIKVAK